MARRKHTKKRHHRRRRSSGISGTGASMTGVVAMLAGAVAGKIASAKVLPNVDPKMKAVGQVAVGFGLNRFVKNPFLKGMGTGMIIGGGLQALTSFGVISAISGIGAGVEVDYMSGDDDMMSGDDSYLGADDEMSGVGFDGSSTIQTIAGLGGSTSIDTLAGDEDYY